MHKVSRRGGFSDRNNIKSVNTTIQITDFDKRTRVQLQNMLSYMYGEVYQGDLFYQKENIQAFFRYVLGEIYAERIDVRNIYNDDDFWKMVNGTILNDEYDDVLTLIEGIIQHWDEYIQNRYLYNLRLFDGKSVFSVVNEIFEQEYIGYRFIDGIITPITDDLEINAIDETLKNKYEPVNNHISKANSLLADRDNPDYENSIKESISAVEALCQIIAGVDGREATLGNTLKKMEDNGVIIHKGLQSAFQKLYGYTSNANGVRHAGDIGGPSSTFEEAKFMLVACCAFINYLTSLNAD